VDQIVKTMERFWGKRYDRAALRRLYGADLEVNPLAVTLFGGKPHERAVAACAAADAGRRELEPQIRSVMDDEYPLVRFFAARSLERLR
jgi:hypothetical protein